VLDVRDEAYASSVSQDVATEPQTSEKTEVEYFRPGRIKPAIILKRLAKPVFRRMHIDLGKGRAKQPFRQIRK